MRKSGLAGIAFAAIAVIGVAGCGDDGSDNAGDSGAASEPDASTIEVNSTAVGDVLTDASGLTLYMFDKDTEGKSACEDDCLAAWPVVEGEPDAGDGADAGLIGTIDRSDGSAQATYAGHPLYYFAKDAKAGEVKGQGVGDIWWVLDSKGTPIDKAVPEDSGTGQGGY